MTPTARFHRYWAATLLAITVAGCTPKPSATSAEPPASTPAGAEGPRRADASREQPATSRAGVPNRLIHETSPYLQQHAHNPVDWYPWGPEALTKAQSEDKVIFLSVGYSSCHWCHVMERESFMDPEIAALLNEHFVCIKVDREERPDVDAIYMTALQLYNRAGGAGGGGGWPMSMFLLPDARPFFGGTYFPPRDGDRGARMGFLTLLQRVQAFWETQRQNLEQDAATLTRLVRAEMDGRRPAPLSELDASPVSETVERLWQQFDDRYGGFRFEEDNPQIPKFPEPPTLLFLVERLRQEDLSAEQTQRARTMLLTTLDRMAMGGIRDHVGGGFHRYSVDRFWRIPHFEKMLYDNGQLATVYSEAYGLTGNPVYAQVVDELLQFVAREMTATEGGFYAALDADTDHEEGKFYRWTKQEAAGVLTGGEAELLSELYGLKAEPNFEGEYYVLQLARTWNEEAEERGLTPAELTARVAPLRERLLAARQQRTRPLTDTKILASWNGLMIRGYADAGRIQQRQAYLDVAQRAADFALSAMRTEDGRLYRTFSAGQPRLNAYLDDYAFLVDGLIALHLATGDARWLEAADGLTRKQIEMFWDEEQGGFYFTSDDHESLIARGRDPVDGAEPSGNAVSATNLLYLAKHLPQPEYRQKAERTIRSVGGLLQAAPAAAPRMVSALATLLREDR